MEVAAAGVDCMYPLAYEYSQNAHQYGKNGDTYEITDVFFKEWIRLMAG